MDRKVLKKIIIFIFIIIIVLGIVLINIKSINENYSEKNVNSLYEKDIDNKEKTDWKEIDELEELYLLENILIDYVESKSDNKVEVLILNAKSNSIDDIMEYFVVEALFIDGDTSQKKNLKFAVEIDWEVENYVVKKVDDFENIIKLFDDVPEDDYTMIDYKDFSEFDSCMWYFSNYRKQLLYNSDHLYEILDEEYRIKKFNNSKEEFSRYVSEIKDKVKDADLVKFSVKNENDEMKYLVLDSNNYYYEFTATSAMNYIVKIDIYAVEKEEKIEENF